MEDGATTASTDTQQENGLRTHTCVSVLAYACMLMCVSSRVCVTFWPSILGLL